MNTASPARSLAITLLFIIVGEALIMLLLGRYLPEEATSAAGAAVDAGILFVIAFPVLYFFYYKPLEKSQEELRGTEERTQLILENSPAAIYETGLDGKCLFVNKAFLDILHYKSNKDVIGKNTHELFHNKRPDGSSYPESECSIHQALRRGEFVHVENEVFWRSDGSSVPVEYWSNPVIKEGTVVSSVVSFVDITERELAKELAESNQKLRRAMDDLEKTQAQLVRSEKLASLGSLSAGVAHEIRNPLNIISTSIQLLKIQGDAPPETLEIYEIIAEQVRRAVRITDNLSDFARQRKPERKEIDVHKFLDKTLSLVEYEMQTENIRVKRDYAPESIRCKCDPDHIAQVFLNLVTNARDSMNKKQELFTLDDLEKKGWEGVLTIKTRADDSWIHISFRDTGMGIPGKYMDKIFEPFFSTKDEYKGTGLGLAISYGLIESHGGRIDVSSEDGEWAEFTVTLPLDPAAGEESQSRR